MPKQCRKTVLVDTSFLITLFDYSRDNHEIAKKYYKYFIENGIDMYISAIVASEYSQKGSIEDIMDTDNFIALTMTLVDGIEAGNFSNVLSGESNKTAESRVAVKDDIKLLAQCSNNRMDYIATDDSSTLAKYARRLKELGKLNTQVITMNSYDLSIFNNGQTVLNIESN